MRFFAVGAAALGLLTSQVAADGAAINEALQLIDHYTALQNDSVVAYSGKLLDAPPILDLSSDLIEKIDNGTSVAKKSAALSTNEALTIYSTVLALQADVQTTLDNFIDAKSKFEPLHLDGIVYLTLKLVKKRTDLLGAAISAKVPTNLASTANQAVSAIDDLFDKAIQVYYVKES